MLVPIFSGATVFLYIVFDKDWGTPALMRLYFRHLREELEELLEATFRS
ncbi:MAG: hypothetical protein H6728_08705 [Myxococcales bacterium]|nr:hypothetical protein [Myxococcales bacterium]